VLQAQRDHPEEGIGTSADEIAFRAESPQEKTNPKRLKAGR
jgi:hypothetical protein